MQPLRATSPLQRYLLLFRRQVDFQDFVLAVVVSSTEPILPHGTLTPAPSASSCGDMGEGTGPSILANMPRSEAIQKLLVSVAPFLTLLASMTTAARVGDVPALGAEPVITDNVVPTVEHPHVQAPIAESPAVATMEMAR